MNNARARLIGATTQMLRSHFPNALTCQWPPSYRIGKRGGERKKKSRGFSFSEMWLELFDWENPEMGTFMGK